MTLAEYAAPRLQDIRQSRRQLAERDRRREQRIERGCVGQQLDRGLEPLAVRRSPRGARARPCRPGSTSSFRRRLWNAPPSGTATSPEPYQLSSTTVASSPAMLSAVASPAALALVWNTKSQSAGARVGLGEAQAERARELRARRIDVDQRHLGARDARAQKADQRADHARADHGDAAGRPGRRVPGRVERGLHVGGQHRARQRHVGRHRHGGLGRHVEQRLMRMQREHGAAEQRLRPGLDPADGGVAVLHRKRKVAAHERRAHALVLADRHAAGRDQRLGAAADRAMQRPHPHRAGGERAERLVADFRPPRPDIPERLRRPPRPRHAPSSRLDFAPCSPAISCTRRSDMEVVQRARRVRPRILTVSTSSDNENCRPPGAVRGPRPGHHRGASGARRLGAVGRRLRRCRRRSCCCCSALTMPWSVIGFWNATIGFFIMRFAARSGRDRAARAPRACAATSRSRPRPRSPSSCATSRPTA